MPKISITITFELEDGLTPQAKQDLQYLVSDSLYEFEASRLPAETYVTKRYHNDDGKYALGSLEHRAEKVKQVQRRAGLARTLHASALHPEIKEVHDETPDHVADSFVVVCDLLKHEVQVVHDGLEFVPPIQVAAYPSPIARIRLGNFPRATVEARVVAVKPLFPADKQYLLRALLAGTPNFFPSDNTGLAKFP